MGGAFMKCWVVLIDYDYEDREIKAIFDNEQEAMAYVKHHDDKAWGIYDVEEWDIMDKFEVEA